MIKSFNGKSPKIAESAFVSEAAHIIGDVEIGGNSSVWPGAVIRGDFGRIIIGRNCAIEDNCVLHSGSLTGPVQDLTIGDNVSIGHGAVINGTNIGNRVLIGMNATVLHEAVIGDYCIIGACTLVSHGMKVPDRSLVMGVPGKIKGEITKKHLYLAEQATNDYLDVVKQYKNS